MLTFNKTLEYLVIEPVMYSNLGSNVFVPDNSPSTQHLSTGVEIICYNNYKHYMNMSTTFVIVFIESVENIN